MLALNRILGLKPQFLPFLLHLHWFGGGLHHLLPTLHPSHHGVHACYCHCGHLNRKDPHPHRYALKHRQSVIGAGS